MRSSLRRGRPLEGQSREIVYNVHKFMSQQAQVFKCEKFQKVIERTAQSTGVSKRTITRILKEIDEAESSSAGPSAGPSTAPSTRPMFKTPKKGRVKKKFRLELDEFDYQDIRRKVYDLQLFEKHVFTIKSLLNKLKQDIDFTGSRESLRQILKELSFKLRKSVSNHKILVEDDKTRLQRIKYLRQVKQYRNEGREIIYADETYYVHSAHTNEISASDESDKEVKKQILKVPRLTILHAGGVNGSISGTLMYISVQAVGDSHNKINKKEYEKWLQEMLIPHLKPNSVLVVDSASYHCTLEEKAPTSYATLTEMQKWLTSKKINFDPGALKPVLYNIIKQHKHQYVKYSLDTIMEAHGHKVLRLPPYHPHFNPIKSIYAQVKSRMSKHNVATKLTEVKQLLTETMSSIGRDEWLAAMDRTIKCEDEVLMLEETIDARLDQFMSDLNEDASMLSSPDSESSDSTGSYYNAYEHIKIEIDPFEGL